MGGVAGGRVHHFLHDEDVSRIPAGAVVVARQPSARLVLVMDRIAAIITEVGSPTDHMTILAREFRIPTLVDVGGATKVLQSDQLVTVDADAALIYPGLIPELLQRRLEPDEAWRSDPVFLKLRRILKSVSRLNLLDPESPDFKAANCRTLHDLTRFCHEKAMDAMFIPDMEKALESHQVSRLKTDLPLNLFILDLGGGLKVTGQEQVTEDDIVSRPFKALLRGFHHPGVTWAGQVAPDFKGFISVFANTMYDTAKAERGLGGKSFAIVTESYLNFNSRIGYHFGIVDAFISAEKNDNYISFQFKGGAAAVEPPGAPGPPGQAAPGRPGLQGPDQRGPGPGPPGETVSTGNRRDHGNGRAAHRLLPPTRPGPVLGKRPGTLPPGLQKRRLQPQVPPPGRGDELNVGWALPTISLSFEFSYHFVLNW